MLVHFVGVNHNQPTNNLELDSSIPPSSHSKDLDGVGGFGRVVRKARNSASSIITRFGFKFSSRNRAFAEGESSGVYTLSNLYLHQQNKC